MIAVADRPETAAPGRAVARLPADHPARLARPVRLARPARRAAPRGGSAARALRSVATVALGMAAGFAIVGFVTAFAASAAVVAVVVL